MNEIKNLIPQSEWDTYTEEQKEINAARHNRSTHGHFACQLCGRTISDKALDNAWHVHMNVSGELVRVGFDDTTESQGWFPVGTDCAKNIPLAFRKRWNQ
jgi:hypothetical protein